MWVCCDFSLAVSLWTNKNVSLGKIEKKSQQPH